MLKISTKYLCFGRKCRKKVSMLNTIWQRQHMVRACERSVSGAEDGAGRKSGGAELSVERAWQQTMERERSAEWEVAERERSGRGGYRNRLARGAAFSPLTLRSHALHLVGACA